MSLLLYRSSSGAGKTFTLIKNYLKIALVNPNNFSKILAITFTNKAAGEMKLRIIENLTEQCSTKDNFMISLVRKELENEGRKLTSSEINDNGQKLLSNILHNYSDFNVMTIDSFLHKVIRIFTKELDLPLNFDVDMDIDNLIKKISDIILDSASPSSFSGKILKDLSLTNIHRGKSWNIVNEIQKLGGECFKEKNLFYINHLEGKDDEFWQLLIKKYKTKLSEFRNTVNSLAKKALKIFEEFDLTITDFKYGKSGIAGKMEKFSKAVNPRQFELSKRFMNAEWLSNSAPKHVKQKITEMLNSTDIEILRDEIEDYISRNLKDYITDYLIFKNLHLESFLSEFKRHLEIYKKANNILPISDFGSKISQIVEKENVPFIYYRLGEKYRYILIDEFQDTSSLQWKNIFPLVENSVAYGDSNMAVGDGKQAIYRWRSGDVEIMEEKILYQLPEFLKQCSLTKNYRSRRTIVQFNNNFFADIFNSFPKMDFDLIKQLYRMKEVKQEPVDRESGYVQLQSFDKAGKKQERVETVLANLVADIEEIIKEKKGYSYSDIAVLTRTNKEGNAVAEELSQNKIPIVSPDSLLLKNAVEVRLIISVLRYLNNDDLPELTALTSQYCELTTRNFGRYVIADKTMLLAILPLEFEKNLSYLKNSPLYNCIENIIDIFNLNSNNQAFVQGFLEVVFSYSAKFKADMNSFLDWWDSYKDSDKCALIQSGNKDAVTITTIHKAKGLEFPIVFVPFGWKLEPKSSGYAVNMLWVERNSFPYLVDIDKYLKNSDFEETYREEYFKTLLDNLNLLYVAFTRPKERLYIYYQDNKKNTMKTTSDLIKARLGELELNCDSRIAFSGEKTIKREAKVNKNLKLFNKLPNAKWQKRLIFKKYYKELWKLEDKKKK